MTHPSIPALRRAAAPLLLGTLAACASFPIGTFGAISTREVDLTRADIDALPRRPAVGSVAGFRLFGLFDVGFDATLADAVEDALDDGDGDLLADAYASRSEHHFLLFSIPIVRVYGDAIRSRTPAGVTQ